MFVVTSKKIGRCILRRYVAVAVTLSLLSPVAIVFAADSLTPQLPEVVVTATRTEVPLNQVGSAITVITREDLEARQTKLVSDVLREVPGVAVNRGGGVGQLTQVRIRGAESNHTLVLIDGIEVDDPSSGSEFNFADLLAADIERIEILRGSQSALYGPDAIGGVINIITRPGAGPAHVSASLEGGSFGTGQANASVGGGGKRYNYLLSATKFHTDGISAASERRGNHEPDSYDNDTLFGKFGVSPSDILDLDFVGRYTGSSAESDGLAGGIGTIDDNSKIDGRQRYAHAQARLKLLDGHWEHILGLGYTEHDSKFLSDFGDSDFIGDKRRLDYQTNLSFGTPGQIAHTLTFSADDEHETVVVKSKFLNVNRHIDTRGYVGEYQLGLFDRLFLTGSVRADDNTLFKDATTGRFTAAYIYAPTTTKFKGSYGTGIKNPTVFELYGFSPDFIGNPDLKPEQSKGWDAGIEQSFLADKLKLDATWFDQRITNLIEQEATKSINLPGESRSEGLELAADLNLGHGLDLHGAYTYTNTRDANGRQLTRRPRHIGSLNIHQTLLDNRVNLNLGILYNGRQDDTVFNEDFSTSTVSLHDYTLVNLAGSWQLSKTLQFYGRIENLADEHYEEVFSYGTPGRAAYVGFRVNL